MSSRSFKLAINPVWPTFSMTIKLDGENIPPNLRSLPLESQRQLNPEQLDLLKDTEYCGSRLVTGDCQQLS